MVNGVVNSGLGVFGPQGKSELGKDDFLKLMIEQLKNQDPLSPMEGTEFTAQLAQFSSLEQLNNMSKSLEQSISANFQLTQAVNNTMTASLIGKEVKLEGTSLVYNGQTDIGLGYNLPDTASSVTVKIFNQDGVLVKSFDGLEKTKGDHKLSWDFTDNNGGKVPIGNYRFEVEAKSMNNEDMVVKPFRTGLIDSLRFTDNGTMLVIDNIEYNLADVYEILNAVQVTSGGR